MKKKNTVPVPITCGPTSQGSLDKLPHIDPLVNGLREPGLELGVGHVLVEHSLDVAPAKGQQGSY